MNTSIWLSWRKRGFTLVEMLVSVAVLAIIMAMVGQIVSSASQAIGNAGKILNTDDQARLIFGRMASDFSRMVKRSDVDIIFSKQTGNDAIFFVTQASGTNSNGWYTGASKVADLNPLTLAGYCIAADPTVMPATSAPNVLLRLGHALSWDPSDSSLDSLVFVSFAAPTNSSSTSALILGNGTTTGTTLDSHWGTTTLGAATDTPPYKPPTAGANYGEYHVMGDQVFRFEYCFLLKDGTYSSIPIMTCNATYNYKVVGGPPAPANDNSHTPVYSTGSRWFDTTNGRAFTCVNPVKNNAVWAPLGLQDVSAIIVSIALLDRDSRKTISPSTYNGLAGLLADYPTSYYPTASTASTITTTFPTASTPTTLSPKLMQQAWQAQLNDTSAAGFFKTSALPAASDGHVRIYQRYFYLNANNL